jgi:hypothetical protein
MMRTNVHRRKRVIRARTSRIAVAVLVMTLPAGLGIAGLTAQLKPAANAVQAREALACQGVDNLSDYLLCRATEPGTETAQNIRWDGGGPSAPMVERVMHAHRSPS